MARKRYIKPGFFDDEDMAECSPLARLLFIGLWCYADKNGILEDRQKYLSVKIFPYGNDIEITILFNELLDHPKQFLFSYEVEGKNYFKIKNFAKHQNPHPKEKPEFPEPAIKKNYQQLKKNASKPLTLTKTLTRTRTKKTYSPDSEKQEPGRSKMVKNNFHPEDVQFVETMRRDISKYDSNRKFTGTLESWAEDIRKLREIDNRTLEEIRGLWVLIQEDPFWHKQILSAFKFRQKFSDLKSRMENGNNVASPFDQARELIERKKQ